MPQIPSDPELKAIESALGELVPQPSRLDRDKLMFQAGSMSRRAASRRWLWPAITAVLCVALAGESIFLGNRPAPQVVERIVFVPAPQTGSTAVATARVSQAIARPGAVNEPRHSAAAREPLSVAFWAVESDYQRFQELVIRFGLDALPERSSVVSRSDSDESPGRGLRPAGALRSLELERILKPGGPS